MVVIVCCMCSIIRVSLIAMMIILFCRMCACIIAILTHEPFPFYVLFIHRLYILFYVVVKSKRSGENPHASMWVFATNL